MRPGRIDSGVGQATRCGSGFCRRSIGAFVAAVEARHHGVDVRRATAEELPFQDAEFDATLAQLFLLMDDPAAGMAEMVRVTRKRGVVAASVWDYAGGRGPVSMLWDAARDRSRRRRRVPPRRR